METVQTAGGYGSYTASTQRTVPDLFVPGGVGKYPLRFVRYSTSRYVPGDDSGGGGPFGAGGSWRHNYRWALYRDNTGVTPAVWRVHYPDGAVVRFTTMPVASPNGGAAPPPDPYLRSNKPGVRDRLAAPTGQSPVNSTLTLILGDGSEVAFTLQSDGVTYHATSIIDPYLQTTTLAYYPSGPNSGKLQTVTEPAGRTLTFSYAVSAGYLVISSVQASNGQSVNYSYTSINNYCCLTTVTYISDPDPATNAPCFATYSYTADNTNSGLRPLLSKCDDPHFGGPLHTISYNYATGTGVTFGQIAGELSSFNSPSTTVSSFTASTRTDTRGDGPAESFAYGYAAPNNYLISSKVDFENNTTSYGYDANDFLSVLVDRNHHTTNILREPYAGKRMTVTSYDNNNQPLTASFDYGSTQSVPYPVFPYYLAKFTNQQGLTTTYGRDQYHQVIAISYPSGGTEALHYTSLGQVYSHTLVTGNVLTNYFDNRGMLQQSTDSFNGTNHFTKYSYDGCDRLTQVIDFNNHNTFFTYNGRHALTQIKHDDGTHIDYTYDKYGNRLTVSNELGKITTTAYDAHRRPTSITLPGDSSAVVTFNYDRAGAGTANDHIMRAYSAMTYGGKVVQRSYSGNGRLKSTTPGYGTPDAATVNYVYDAVGNLLSATDPLNRVTKYGYDALNRKSTVTDPLNHVTTWSYFTPGSGQNTGKLSSIQFPDGTTNLYANYDLNGEAQTIQDQLGGYETHYFDYAGRPTQLWNRRNPSRAICFYYNDPRGLPSETYYQDGTTQTVSYDAVGNAISSTNRAGVTCASGYDDRNRLTSNTWSDGGVTPSELYQYDAVGRPTALYNGYTAVTYAYDDAGRLLSEGQQPDGTWPTNYVTYTYHPDNLPATLTYPSGNILATTYTNREQLTGETFELPAFGSTAYQAATYYFNLDGTVASRYLPNGTCTGYAYDAGDRIISVVNKRYSPSYKDISQRVYGYDANSRMTWFYKIADNTSGSSTEDGKGDAYYYDADSQLTFVNEEAAGVNGTPNANGDSAPGTSITQVQRASSFAYDPVGNRSQVNNTNVVDTYGAGGSDPANHNDTYPSITDSVTGAIPITNDTRADTASYAGWTYTYDAKGQLLSAVSGATSVSFIYDALGRRTRRYLNGVLQRIYHYDGWKVIEEDNGSNQNVYNYLYGAGGELVERVAANGSPIWYHHDARGFITHVTDSLANVLEQYLYDAYGAVYILDATGTQRPGNVTACDNHYFWANSYEWQPEMGAYLCGHRFYHPQLGRFLTPDPSGLGGGDVNLFRYCGNDPINGFDPTGEITGSVNGFAHGAVGVGKTVSYGFVVSIGSSLDISLGLVTTTTISLETIVPNANLGLGLSILPFSNSIYDLNGTSYGANASLGLNGGLGAGGGVSNASVQFGDDATSLLARLSLDGTVSWGVSAAPSPLDGNIAESQSITTVTPITLPADPEATSEQTAQEVGYSAMSSMNLQQNYVQRNSSDSQANADPLAGYVTDPDSLFFGQALSNVQAFGSITGSLAGLTGSGASSELSGDQKTDEQ